jgi:hypothetical protein
MFKVQITSLSGNVDETREFSSPLEMVTNYNEMLHELQMRRFELKTKDVFIFKTPSDTMCAYRNVITGDVECVTADLFYRRFYSDAEVVKKVKIIAEA